MKLDVTVMDQQYRDQLRGQREELEKVPRNFFLKERDFESHGYREGCPGCISLLKRGTRLAHSKGCRVRMEEVMKGDERLERANKRTNEHLAKLVKANVEKAEAEKKAKLDKDMEVDTGVGERHGASSSTEMATGSGTKRDIDTDDGDASSKKMRVNKVVELVPAKAVVNEMDEELMDEDWGCGLEADEWVVQDWEKCEKELAEARDEEVKYMVEKLNIFEFYSEDDMKAITSEAPTSTKWVDVRKMNDDGEEFMRSRLVARDFRPRRGPDRPDLFVAMPPLEAKRMLFIMTVAGGAFEQRGSKDEQKLMFIDVRKAHLNGVVDD